jgi:hypothetical protein
LPGRGPLCRLARDVLGLRGPDHPPKVLPLDPRAPSLL